MQGTGQDKLDDLVLRLYSMLHPHLVTIGPLVMEAVNGAADCAQSIAQA